MPLLERFERRLPGVFGAVVGTREGPAAAHRADEIFPAASLIKIPLLALFFRECESGRLDLNRTVKLKRKEKVGGSGILFELHDGIPVTLLDLATLMIVVSDNTATNLVTDQIGMKKIPAGLKALGLKKTIYGRKLMVAPNDPPANFTTPMEMFVLLKKLAAGELLSRRNTGLALDILFRQQYNEKIPLLLPEAAKVAHKTGEISGVRHDCGIVREGNGEWIGCFLTKKVRDELKADRIIAEAALACHEYYRGKGRKHGK